MLNDAFHVVACYLPEETKLFKAHYVENHGKSAGNKTYSKTMASSEWNYYITTETRVANLPSMIGPICGSSLATSVRNKKKEKKMN